MKIVECEQGDMVWKASRLGIPTASSFAKILTPKTLQPSKSTAGYMAELLAEWAIGLPIEGISTRYTDHGENTEAEARDWYSLVHAPVEVVGFVLRDDEQVGGSPDGLVGDDGGVDFKCPTLPVHLKYLLEDEEMPYQAQVQGYMYLTGRKWWDLVSYSRYLPRHVVRVERDEKYMQALDKALAVFTRELDARKRRLLDMGHQPPEWVRLPEPEAAPEEVVDAMWDADPATPPCTSEQQLRLSVLIGQLGTHLTPDEQMDVQGAIQENDGPAADRWIRKLERMVDELASVTQESLL